MSEAPSYLPADQLEAWQPECRTWTFPLEIGEKYGVITVWPTGRGAISWGDGMSFWGNWDGNQLELDEGGAVDSDGWPLDDAPELVEPGTLDGFVGRAQTADSEAEGSDVATRGGKLH